MTKRWGESGNIFFTLFGAVALVGVVGAATSTLMRGPVGTVVSLNQRAKADSQMQIAMKLAMLEAQQRSTAAGDPAPDCDVDGLIEPTAPGAVLPGLTGGGQLPSVGSTTNDPWGVAYGYCGWDHGDSGGSIIGGGCANASGVQPLLDGVAGASGVVLAVISAGPDRQFGVTCNPSPASSDGYFTRGANGADDIIVDMTYAEANEASGGLWFLQSGNPNAITTGRELDVQQGAQFSSGDVNFNSDTSFGAGATLDLSAGALFFLPDEATIGFTNADCNDAGDSPNFGVMRRNTAGGTQEALQICDGYTTPAAPVWVNIGGSGGSVAAFGNDTEIQFNAGGVAGVGGVLSSNAGLRFNSGGGLSAAGNSVFGADVDVADALTVDGLTQINDNLNVTGNADITGTLSADGATTIDDTLGVTGNADFDSGIDVTGNLTIATGALLNADGTVGAPSFSFTGATGSGIYYSSGMGFSIGGTNEMTLSSSGLNVTDLTTGSLTVNNTMTADRFLSRMATTSAALPGFETEPGTGMYSAVDNTLTLVTGGTSRFVIDGTGDVGIGVTNPDAMLDVGGEIKVGTSLIACGPTLHGAIRYVSGDLLQVCSSTTNIWESIGTSGGGGGGAGSYWTRISVGDPRLYYDTDFVGVGTNDPLATFHVNGDFLTTGAYSGTASAPVSGAGTRVFFDPESGAFRAGTVSGAQWDSGNVGNYSYAFGYDAQASGLGSRAFGSNVTASGVGSLVIGENASATNLGSAALGLDVVASGVRTTAWGLGDATGASPIFSGTESFGIVMGDQSGINMTANTTMALLGGRMLIDMTPAANPAVSNTLSLDVEGGVGAVQYCDENGVNCFTAASVATGGVGAPGSNREVIFNSNGVLGTDVRFTFSSAGNLTLGGTGAIALPVGDVGNRPAAPTNGMLRYNSTSGKFEGYQAGNWYDIITTGGGGIAIDDLTDAIADYTVNYNLFMGDAAGNLTATGDDNTAVGIGALEDLTTGASNTAFGNTALNDNTIGISNTGIGAFALINNLDGSSNTAVGTSSMFENISGGNNTALGTGTLYDNLSGSSNVAIGSGSINGLTTGSQNVGVGTNALFVTNGMNNVALGHDAGNGITSGSSNIVIGHDVDALNPAGNNQLNIGNLIYGTTNAGLLAINGTGALTLPIGVTGNRPTGVDGMLRYNSVSGKFEGYQGGTWQDILTSAVAGGAAAPDRGIQFNSGGNFGADANFVFTSAGSFMVSGIHTGIGAAPASGAGTRMFFDPSKSAFRTGSTTGVQWNNSSIGNYSIAMGFDATASGDYSAAMGAVSTASGNFSIAMGQSVLASGANSTAIGQSTTASGFGSTAIGVNTVASGNYSTATGFATSASGNYSVAIGDRVVAGDGIALSGFGDASVAFGLIDDSVTITTPSQVRGIQSMGIFMGDQDGLIMSANNNMGLFGGQMVIDPRVPAQQLSARATLDLGASTDAILLPIGQIGNRPGAPVNGMLRYNSVSGKFEGYQGGTWQDILTSAVAGGAAAPDRGIQFNSGGSFAASNDLIYSSTGALSVSGTYTGTSSAPLSGAGTRMLFDPATGALRAGTVTGAQWDNANIGIRSTAFGIDNTASGGASFAAGDNNLASNTSSVALGSYNTASGFISTAIGQGVASTGQAAVGIGSQLISSGYGSMALGSRVIAGNGVPASGFGDGSMALGLIDDAVTITANPQVRGIQSYGIFMGDQDGLVMTANNTMGLFGGQMVVDPNVPATQLSARATLDLGASTDAILLPIGQVGNRPGTPVNGMLRYNSVSGKFEGYQGGTWQDILTSAVAGGAAAPDRGVQFNSGGSFAANSNFQYTSAGTLLLSGTYTGTGTEPVSGAGTRMFFDPRKSAFRAGTVNGNQWNYTSTGNNSTAIGTDAVASGNFSTAIGSDVEASGQSGLALGNGTRASGDFSTAIGDDTRASGDSSIAIGNDSFAVGNSSTAMGNSTNAGGNNSTAMGNSTISSGDNSTAMGFDTVASGINSTVMGRSVTSGNGTAASGFGDGSMALGLIDDAVTITTRSQVQGIQSYGIFMGDQDGLVMTADNTMGLFGGRFVMDPRVPAQQLTPRADMDLGASSNAILLPIGQVGNRPSSPVNGMLRYNSVSGKFEGYQAGTWQDILTSAVAGGAAAPNRGIQFNSNGSFAASTNMQYTSGGSLLLTGTHTGTSDTSLPTGAGTRIFFDPSKSAFRAGAVSAGQWDFASTGEYSMAGGLNTIASAWGSTAFGATTTASGNYSTAVGDTTTASGDYSISMGRLSGASGINSIALGFGNTASGLRSAAIGTFAQATNDDTFAIGNTAQATGIRGTAIGYNVFARGQSALSMGANTTASGFYSTAMGRAVVGGNGTAGSGLGDGSFALGLIDDAVTITTPSQVHGIQSYGIFMGDQDGLVMTANNTMGVFGGQLVIDPNVPATQLSARGVIDVGAATTAVVMPAGTTGQRPGAPVNGMLRYNSQTSRFEAYMNNSWQDLISGTGGLYLDNLLDVSATTPNNNDIIRYNSASGMWEAVSIGSLVAGAASPDRGIQFNSGGDFAADDNFQYVYSSSDPSLVLYDGTDSTFVSFTPGLSSAYIDVFQPSDGARDLTVRTRDFIVEGSISGEMRFTSNGRLGIGTATPRATLDITATDSIVLPSGTTAQRSGAAVNGMLRYNSQTGKFEGYQAGAWQDILTAGASTSIDALTDAITSYTSSNMYLGAGSGDNTTTGGGNTSLGHNALAVVTTGYGNSATGAEALQSNTIGINNSAFGAYALRNSSSGFGNSAFGTNALMSSTTNNQNTAIGAEALKNSTIAYNNTAVGYEAGVSNVAGSQLTAIGFEAMKYANDTATPFITYNTAIGAFALQGSGTASANTGATNTAIGHSALRFATSGGGNTAIGANALAANTTGSDNIAIGAYTLDAASTASANVAIGQSTLGLTTVGDNTAVGAYALSLATGGPNTAFGSMAGNSITTGVGNLLLGYNVDTPTATTNNYLNIGNLITGTMNAGLMQINGTGALTLPIGQTGDRPAGVNGMIRYNSVSGKFEGYQAGAWQDILTSAVAGGAAAPDRGIQFNSGGSFAANSNFTYTSVGTLQMTSPSDNNSFLDARNSLNNQAVDLGLNYDYAYLNLYNDVGNNVVTMHTYHNAGPNFGAYAINKGATPGDNYGSAVAITIPNGLNNENGIYMTDAFSPGDYSQAPAAAITFYDSDVGQYSAGGLRFKTSSITGGMTTRMQIDQHGLISFTSTGAVALNVGTTAQRPTSPVNGMLRYNSQTNKFEGYQGGAWLDIITAAGVIAIDDLTDAATNYTSGNMFLGQGSGSGVSGGNNTALGMGALGGTTSGNNIAIGTSAGTGLVGGGNGTNIAIGVNSMASGNQEVSIGIGFETLWQSTASSNIAIGGYGTMYGNTVGANNIALGNNALWSNDSGSGSVAVGYDAMRYANNSATPFDTYNTAVGTAALRGSATPASNTGTRNTALGFSTLVNNTSGSFNTGVGSDALGEMTTGSGNTAVGQYALNEARTSSNNSAFGNGALAGSGAGYPGDSNTGIGAGALGSGLFTGSNNVGLGRNAGNNLTSGTNSIAIGSGITFASTTGSYQLNIGNLITGQMDAGLAQINGTGALTLPIGQTGNRPTGVNGMIRYNSQTSKFEGYQGGAWTDIITAGGTAASPDRGIQFNSGGAFAANSNLVYTSQGSFMVSGTYTGTATVPATGAGTRMFFDPHSGAFRAGSVVGGAWDNASVGAHSISMGNDSRASGADSISMGPGNIASGSGTIAIGANVNATGNGSVAIGSMLGSMGSGINSTAIGWASNAVGSNSVILGSSLTASGINGMAMGRSVTVGDGTASNGLGDGSMALGLIDDGVTITAPSQVRGIQSYGIFMGDQDGLVMTANNTLGLFGGQMVIDPRVPAQQLAARATLDLGAATDAIVMPLGATSERPSSPVNGMMRYNSTTGKFEGYQAGTWTDIVTGAASVTFLSLTDTPSSYAGQGSKIVRVNAGATALEFTDQIVPSISGAPAATAPNLDYLGDVTIASPTAGQTLFYSGGQWINGAAGAGAAGGSTTQVQFNSGGVLSGNANFTWASNALDLRTSTAGTQNVMNIRQTNGGGNAAGINFYNNTNTLVSRIDGWDGMLDLKAIGNGTDIVVTKEATTGNSVLSNLILRRYSTGGAGSNGIGSSIQSVIESTTDGTNRVGSEIQTVTTDAAAASFTTRMTLIPRYNNTATTGMTLFGSAGGTFVGINNIAPTVGLDILTTDAMILPRGTTAQRPGAPVNGMMRYNSTTGKFEGYQAGLWSDIITAGGVTSIDNLTDAITNYTSGNIYLGTGVGATTTTGTNNIGLGTNAMAALTSGARNTAIGGYALASLQDGSGTAVGFGAMFANVSGYGSVALGGYSLNAATAAINSVAIGDGAFELSTSALNSVGIGYRALRTATGADNIAIGNQAGDALTTGTNNIIMGSNIDFASNTGNYQLNIGGLITGTMNTGLAQINGTGALTLPVGQTGNRPTGVNGMIRYNSQTSKFEGYQGGAWLDIITAGGSAATPDRGIQFNSGGAFTASSAFTYTSSGRLGLGEATPTAMLHINTGLTGLSPLRISNTFGGAAALRLENDSGGMRLINDSSSGIFPNDAADLMLASSRCGGEFDYCRTGLLIKNSTGNLIMTGWSNAKTFGMERNIFGFAGADFSIYAGGASVGNTNSIGGNLILQSGIATGNGASSILFQTVLPNQGTGTTARTPSTAMVLASNALTLPTGTTAQRPGQAGMQTAVDGMLRYNSQTGKFEGYQAGTWSDIITAGGSAATPDRGIQFNSGGSFAANAGLVFSSTGDFMVSGVNISTPSVPVSGAGTRMFFDVGSGAFRAGASSGTEWDNAQTGTNSVAMGNATQASGNFSTALGSYSVADGNASTAIGQFATADAAASVALGENVTVTSTGANSFAFGLGYATGSFPRVSGAQSFGIFMSDQSGVNVSAANTMGLFGGKMVIDPRVPAQQLTARGVIDVGAATDAIVMPLGATSQRPSSPVNGMLRYNSTTSKFEGYQAGAWADIITGAASVSFLTLTDTPSSYASQGLKYVRVNSGATALEFTDQIVPGVAGQPAPTNTILDDLGDVVVASPTAGQILTYSGGNWVNGAASGGGGSIDGLSDGKTDYVTGHNLWMGSAAGNAIAAGGTYNAVIGEVAGDAITTGDNNVGLGYSALGGLATGSNNTGVGAYALSVATSDSNAAFGAGALASLTSGNNNTAVGAGALALGPGTNFDNAALGNGAAYNITGSENTAIGSASLSGSSGLASTRNTAVGYGTMRYTPGSYNVALGYGALIGGGSGTADYNIAIGANSLIANTDGDNNTSIGADAMGFNTTGYNNVAIGPDALRNNRAKRESTAIGFLAMGNADSTTTGAVTYNTAVGAYALQGSGTPASNTGIANTAVGHSALAVNTSGIRSTAVGASAMGANTTGSGTAVGYNAMVGNITGSASVAIGGYALNSNTASNYNVALGESAMESGTTGDNSIGIGYRALRVMTGSSNIGIGYQAGDNITSGNTNIVIGYDLDAPSATASNQLNIGGTIYGDMALDKIGIGVNTATQTYDLTFSSSGNKTIGVNDNAGAGRDLTLRAGSATSGVSNGGNLILMPGQENSTGTSGIVFVSGGLSLGADVTSASLGASQNDYVPTNGGRAGVYRLTASTPINLTGLAGGSDGRILTLMNIGANAITLVDESVSSAAGNRFALTQNLSLATDQSTVMIYDSTSSRWRIFGADGLGGGGSIDGLTDGKTDYATDHNLWLGQSAGNAIAAGGQYNLAIGELSGDSITTGDRNIGLGYNTITAAVTAVDNIGIGYNALALTAGGDGNIAIGSQALDTNSSGYENIAIGVNAMTANANGGSNIGIGTSALSVNVSGLNNVGIGGNALRDMTGSSSVGIGYAAAVNATGSNIVAVGQNALTASSGSNNIGIGFQAGDSITSGTDNIIIGYNVDAPTATTSNHLNIGNTIYGDISTDRIGIGAAPATGVELDVTGDIQYTGTITDVSDMRLKNNIHPLNDRGSMLDKLGQIGTYSFTMKDDAEGNVEFGVMAQEINKVFPELVRIDEDTAEKYMSVNYVGLIAPLVQASKELKAENDNLKTKLTTLEDRMASIEGDMNGMKAHTGYGISKAQMGMGMIIGMMLMGGFAGAFLLISRRRKV